WRGGGTWGNLVWGVGDMGGARREWLVLAGPSQGGRKAPPRVTRERQGGLCHRSASLANSSPAGVGSPNQFRLSRLRRGHRMAASNGRSVGRPPYLHSR